MKLSVIIPCFNAEKYIQRCLDSIFCIGLPINEFEVICYDDFSVDGTPIILDDYAAGHSNLRIIHSTVNIGPGGGRNKAFSVAKGQYVWFVDADDIIVPEVVERLLKQCENNELDVLIFDYKDIDEEENNLPKNYDMRDTEVMRGYQIGNIAFEGGIVNNLGYPCRFFIRREYLQRNGIFFPEGCIWEDTCWMGKVVLLADRIQASSCCGYMYWHHENSICGEMHNSYQGNAIYDWCVVVPLQLLLFANELESKGGKYSDYAKELIRYSSLRYLNYLPIFLARSSYKGRTTFYKRMNNKREDVVGDGSTLIVRLLLVPYLGRFLSEVISFCYKVTHND